MKITTEPTRRGVHIHVVLDAYTYGNGAADWWINTEGLSPEEAKEYSRKRKTEELVSAFHTALAEAAREGGKRYAASELRPWKKKAAVK